MKKKSLIIFALMLMLPIFVLADSKPKVLTLTANNTKLNITYSGTVENDSHAVMCKLYSSENETDELDMLSLSVDNNSFSGSFTAPDYGSYVVACANYEGGEIKKATVTITKEKFTVSFNTKGGSTVPDAYVEDGSTVEKPEDPTNGNLVFDDWYEDETLNKKFDFDTKITKTMTLYAGWKEKEKFTVSFDTNGGSEIKPAVVESGSTVERPEDPTNGNMIFDGWHEDETLNKAFDFDTKITKNTTLYAGWLEPEKEKFTVSFNTKGGSQIKDQTVELEDTAERPKDPTKEGYTFDDWYEDETLTKLFDFERGILENTILYARWIEDETAKEYTVAADDGTSITFKEEEGKTFTITVVEYTSMTDSERSELGIEKEEYDAAKEMVIEATKKEGSLLGFYEIVVKNDLGNEKHSGDFKIKIKLTDEMKKYKTFKMIYIRDDFTTETPAELKVEDGYLVGTLPHLSAYVLVGNTSNPSTGDNIYIWMATLLVSIIGLLLTVVAAIKFRKQKLSNI